MKGKALMKHSLHEKTAAYVWDSFKSVQIAQYDTVQKQTFILC